MNPFLFEKEREKREDNVYIWVKNLCICCKNPPIQIILCSELEKEIATWGVFLFFKEISINERIRFKENVTFIDYKIDTSWGVGGGQSGLLML